jgi:hypothetical protein
MIGIRLQTLQQSCSRTCKDSTTLVLSGRSAAWLPLLAAWLAGRGVVGMVLSERTSYADSTTNAAPAWITTAQYYDQAI